MSKLGWVLVAVLVVSIPACEKAPLTAPAGTSMFLQANPEFVAANGGVSVVTALLTEPAGTLVPDGTVVLFFTTLGSIDPQGKTVDGVARVNFVADSRSGTAIVTAFSGGPAPTSTSSSTATTDTGSGTGTTSVKITVGSSLPTLVLVSADPARVATSRQSRIVANVFDQFGNPVQNVPVVFSVEPNGTAALEETLDSGGTPQFTDANGRAFDTMRTRAVLGGVQKSVTVTATTANNVPGTVVVFIN
jgi:hypothetical protein